MNYSDVHEVESQGIWAKNNTLVQPVVSRRARHFLTGTISFQTYFGKIIRTFEKTFKFCAVQRSILQCDEVLCGIVHCFAVQCNFVA